MTGYPIRPEPRSPLRELGLLLWPKLLEIRRLTRGEEEHRALRLLVFVGLGLVFWGGVYGGAAWLVGGLIELELIGMLVAAKILSWLLLFFMTLLVYSNIVTAFSTCFLSDDLVLLMGMPTERDTLYWSRLAVTVGTSSGMVIVFGLPIFLAYGVKFGAGLGYYLTVLLALPPLLVIPAVPGVALSQLLVGVFPARRLREVMVLMALLAFIAIYLLFRFARPEDILEPEGFGDMVKWVARANEPASPYLPSHWAAAAMAPLLLPADTGVRQSPTWLMLAALWTTAGAFTYLGTLLSRRFYYESWCRSLEGRRVGHKRNVLVEVIASLAAAPFRGLTRVVVDKEVRIFFRDAAQWSQIPLLAALVVVYLYNFEHFKSSALSAVLGTTGFFVLNLALSGFVLAAVAVRFTFPAVSLEGRAWWIIRASPVSAAQFMRAKFWMNWLPMWLLGVLMAGVSAVILDQPTYHSVASVLCITLLSFTVSGMGVGFGAMYPRFHAENVSQIAAGSGGIIYMLTSMATLVLVVIAAGFSVYFGYRLSAGEMISDMQLGIVVLGAGTAAMLCLAGCVLPMRAGRRRLERRDK